MLNNRKRKIKITVSHLKHQIMYSGSMHSKYRRSIELSNTCSIIVLSIVLHISLARVKNEVN